MLRSSGSMTRRSLTLFILTFSLALGSLWLVRYVLERSASAPVQTSATPQETTTPAAPTEASAPDNGAVHFFREPIDVKPFTFTDINGRTYTSSDWTGKVVLVNFWATWCP